MGYFLVGGLTQVLGWVRAEASIVPTVVQGKRWEGWRKPYSGVPWRAKHTYFAVQLESTHTGKRGTFIQLGLPAACVPSFQDEEGVIDRWRVNLQFNVQWLILPLPLISCVILSLCFIKLKWDKITDLGAWS